MSSLHWAHLPLRFVDWLLLKLFGKRDFVLFSYLFNMLAFSSRKRARDVFKSQDNVTVAESLLKARMRRDLTSTETQREESPFG